MTIIERNFFRLLRAGAFGKQEQIEPLSAWKWHRLYQLSLMHDVEQTVYKGIECCKDQFFVQVPEELQEKWAVTMTDADDGEENELLAADHLTNPLLNKRLQSILDEVDTNTETRRLLLLLLGMARFIMNAGIPVKRTCELAVYIREHGSKVDYERIGTWIKRLKLEPMVQLTGVLLTKIMEMDDDELPFVNLGSDKVTDRQFREILKLKNSHAEDWYFSQGKNIFVHTSNPSAMLWHMRRSARYMRYYPSEMLTNFFASFAHSLSHIEE